MNLYFHETIPTVKMMKISIIPKIIGKVFKFLFFEITYSKNDVFLGGHFINSKIYRDSCNHHHNQDAEHFPEVSLMLFLCPHVLPLIPATTDLFSISIILSFLKRHMNGTISYIPLRDGLSSLSIMLWMFISVVTGY